MQKKSQIELTRVFWVEEFDFQDGGWPTTFLTQVIYIQRPQNTAAIKLKWP